MKLRGLIVTLAVTLMLLVPVAVGQIATVVPLPADLQGELDGVPYRIRVPDNWNGTLLVYAHGYNETTTPPPLAPQPADEAALLGKGFALAASRFAGSIPMPLMATEAGWTVKNAMQNIVALTTAFRDMVGRPRRTIMWGKSMGGLITLGVIEKFPGLFDGAVALCPLAAGTPRMYDHKLDVTLAYAVALGWDDAWGTPGDLRDDLNILNAVYGHAKQRLGPEFKGFWEFLRLVNRIPYDASFYAPANNRLMTLYMAMAPRIDLDRRAGGHVAENLGRMYTLSDADKSYLRNTYNLDPDPLLAAMNAQATYASDRNARNYAEHYVDPTGRIRRPVLTVHTTGDPLAIPNNESAYLDVVTQEGNCGLLEQQFTAGNGIANAHCTFTSAQEIAAIDAMMNWLDTGDRPDPSFFPTAKGFLSGYVPGPWPW